MQTFRMEDFQPGRERGSNLARDSQETTIFTPIRIKTSPPASCAHLPNFLPKKLPPVIPRTAAIIVTTRTVAEDRAIFPPDSSAIASDTPTAAASTLVATAARRRCFKSERSTFDSPSLRKTPAIIVPPMYRRRAIPIYEAYLYILQNKELNSYFNELKNRGLKFIESKKYNMLNTELQDLNTNE